MFNKKIIDIPQIDCTSFHVINGLF